MSKRRGRIFGVVALTMALGVLAGLPSLAQEGPPQIEAQLLTGRASFTDDVDLQIKTKLDGKATGVVNSKDPSRTVVARITVQPGAQFPWHTHPGPVIVNVVQGELVYVNANDCVDRPYTAGTAFIDPGQGNVHTAFNPSAAEVTVLVATFFEVGAEGPLTITAGIEGPEDCLIGE